MIRNFWKLVSRILASILRMFLGIWRDIVGTWSWTLPGWLNFVVQCATSARTRLNRLRADSPKKLYSVMAATLGSLVLGYFAYDYYAKLPKPDLVEVTGNTPTPLGFYEGATPDSLRIQFSKSSAPLDKVGKDVSSLIVMKPTLRGKWLWESDTKLVFSPTEPWPVATDFSVALPSKNFPNHVKLDRSSYDFKTPSFEVKNIATEFYQDPQDPKIKRVILNIYFTHPVEPQGLEDKINLTLGEADNSVISSLMTKSFKFKVTYDKYFSVATVQTDPIPIPTEESVMSYTIGPLKAKGGGESNGDKTGSIKIPGMYSYFRVENADVAYTENEKFETEQILNFALSTEVEAAVFAKKLDVYVLPKDLPEVGAKKVSKNHLWRDAEVGPEILKLSKPLSVVALPTERDSAKLVSFKVGLEPGQCVFVKVSKGLHSFAGYELASDFTKVIKVQDFPERVSIMSHGALLSISGERKVSVATRDVHAVRFKMDRVVPGQLHHFISQTSGRFENASFLSSSFSSENISEVFTDVRSFPKSKKGTTQYSAVDFSEHVKGGRHGLFVFTAEGWDQKRKRRKGPSDQRVILVTDMGMLVKENQDLSLTLFLQSIRDGKPLVGVKVDVLGKNGLSVYSGTVSDQGTLTIPKVTGFRQEKSVVAIVATKGDDIAFLPLNRSDRYLNFSRFDVGGAYLTGDARKMEAYLFSERGIYRPGDLFNIGAIIKSPTWNQAEIQGAPLEYVIRDSRGMEIHKVKFQVNQDGFHEFSYKTEENSPTGTYEIGIHLIKENNRGALIGSTTIKVEEFLPDRLRIATSLSSESAKGWVKLADITGRVALHNLFGTPAQERRVKASFSLVPAAPTFKGWADYQFIDPNKTKSAASEILPELSTNSKGEAEFALPLSKFDRGLYRLTFTAEGYEASGGRGVLSLTKTLVSSLDTMVGVKPDGKLDYVRKDTDRSIHIVAVDGGLNKVAQKGLKANLIEFKYVSVLMRGSNGLYKYESVKKEISLPAQDLNIPPEGFQFKLATNQVGQFALVIKNDKDLELNRVLYSVVGEGDIGKRLDKNSELQIVLSKPDYEAGEDVELQITAPYKGAGIITIEREKVYAVKWFKTDTTNTVQRITVPKGIEGNAYVNVSFIRAQDSKEVFMSPLSYAVMPFTVSRAARTTRVEIVAPELIEPGRPLAISYRTNRPAKIAIYGVDEGILQVAKYVTPAPLDFFLRKRALQVTTFQILDLIMPEFSVLKAASSPGGGEDGLLGANLNPFKRKTMKPIVFWSGIIDATDQAREFRYDVPDYFNGSIKIMAVAVGNGTIGVAEQKTLVRGPFVISPNAPTFVAPGDEFFVSAGVSNNIEGSDEKEIEVSMSSTANLSSIEGKPQILKLAKGREGSALFKVKALDQLGDGTVTFKALSGGKSSLMAVSMSIRPPVVHHSLSQGGLGQGGDLKVTLAGSLYAEFSKQIASISTFPIVLAKGLSTYLDNFPHMCTEQILSRAMSWAILSQYKEIGLNSEQGKKGAAEIVRVLRSRQSSDGSFGLWTAGPSGPPFVAIYAVHILTDLAEAGFQVPQDMLKSAFGFLQGFIAMPDTSIADARDKAYAMYVLQRNGLTVAAALPELIAALDKKHDKPSWKKGLTGAFIASIFQMLQAQSEADDSISKVEFGTDVKPDGARYFDGLRHDSQILYLMSRHFPNRAKALSSASLVKISEEIGAGMYTSQGAAQAILGIHAFAKIQGDIAAMSVTAEEIDSAGKATPLLLKGDKILSSPYSLSTAKVQFKTPANTPLFYQVEQTGFLRGTPPEGVAKHMEVFREFVDDKGATITTAKVGEVVNVRLKIRATDRDYVSGVSMIDLLPGGFEVEMSSKDRGGDSSSAGREAIENRDAGSGDSSIQDAGEGGRGEEGRGEGGGEGGEADEADRVRQAEEHGAAPVSGSSFVSQLGRGSWATEHADVREDRVIIYGSIRKTMSDFTYRARLTTKGVFAIPPVFAESMYERSVHATSKGGTFTVTD